MAILISAHELKKTYGARPLFSGISFAIEDNQRIGLIGPNGAGKSTLLSILAGHNTPDEGKVSMQRGLRIGYLEQTPKFKPDATVLDTVLEKSDADEWEVQSRAYEIMSRLELVDGPVETLSGGWKKRAALARELVLQPDILLLDEPTNHLDVESILWLEEFLAQARFTTVTVTHDRLFLQRVANRILEIDSRNPGGLLSVDGDYTTYLEVKEERLANQLRREVVLKNTLRRETEWLRRGAKARTTKQQARITRAGDLKEEVGELSTRNQTHIATFGFTSEGRNPKRLLAAEGISKKLGDRVLFRDVDLLFAPGTRIGLLGPNGCGKSTLIRALLGEEKPDTGTVERADNLTVAYFEQNRDALDPDLTVAQTICPRGDHVEYRGGHIHIRSYLDRFLFSSEQMDMRVRNLSGGEQSRILIAQLMLRPANLLVLDEPTNDLDMVTLTVLEDCLKEFNGAVLFVTHDRYFLDQVSTKILAFGPGGRLVPFVGVEQWETWQAEQEAAKTEAGRTAAKKEMASSGPAGSGGTKRKFSMKEQHELAKMEATIHDAEAKVKKLTETSAAPETLKSPSKLRETMTALATAQHEVEKLYARWTELEELRAQAD